MIPRTADSLERSTGNTRQAVARNPFSGLVQKAISMTAPMLPKPKLGPQGVSIQDVAARAAGSVPGWRPGMPLPTAQQMADARQSAGPAFTRESVLPGLIGERVPTAGQRYGGFETRAEAEAQILGETYNAMLAGKLAQEEADFLAQPYESEYERLQQPGTREFERTLANNQRIVGTPLNMLATQMAGGTPSAQDLYGANMARMNAIRGTGDYIPPRPADLDFDKVTSEELSALLAQERATQQQANALEMVRRPAELNMQAGLQASGALDAQDFADAIRGTKETPGISVSDLAQRIAVERFGYDPGMAAGIFTMEEDLNYEKALDDAYKAQIMRENPGVNPDDTVADMILKTYGVEGLMQYQDQQAEYALNGTPTQQLAAEQREIDATNALYDESVRQKYGFDPKEIGGVDPQVIRELTNNEDFIELLDQARQAVMDGSLAPDVAREYANKYLERSKESGMADNVGATAMGRIIASFDLSYFE